MADYYVKREAKRKKMGIKSRTPSAGPTERDRASLGLMSRGGPDYTNFQTSLEAGLDPAIVQAILSGLPTTQNPNPTPGLVLGPGPGGGPSQDELQTILEQAGLSGNATNSAGWPGDLGAATQFFPPTPISPHSFQQAPGDLTNLGGRMNSLPTSWFAQPADTGPPVPSAREAQDAQALLQQATAQNGVMTLGQTAFPGWTRAGQQQLRDQAMNANPLFQALITAHQYNQGTPGTAGDVRTPFLHTTGGQQTSPEEAAVMATRRAGVEASRKARVGVRKGNVIARAQNRASTRAFEQGGGLPYMLQQLAGGGAEGNPALISLLFGEKAGEAAVGAGHNKALGVNAAGEYAKNLASARAMFDPNVLAALHGGTAKSPYAPDTEVAKIALEMQADHDGFMERMTEARVPLEVAKKAWAWVNGVHKPSVPQSPAETQQRRSPVDRFSPQMPF